MCSLVLLFLLVASPMCHAHPSAISRKFTPPGYVKTPGFSDRDASCISQYSAHHDRKTAEVFTSARGREFTGNSTSAYLQGKIPVASLRYNTFVTALNLMEQRNVKTVVETGTSRHGIRNCEGDGCSTAVFGEWARDHDATLYSIDINAEALMHARAALASDQQHVSFIHSDSVEFLKDFGRPIDMLYLDSYDFEAHSPGPSQKHHLREILAAEPWLTQESIVMIDDCNLPHGGKGSLVIAYLLSQGWRIVAKDYQVILVRE